MKKINLISFTKWILDFMLISGILITIALPFLMHLAGKYYSASIEQHIVAMMLIFGSSAIFGLLIVVELRSMMKTVIANDCFVTRNVQSLERMGAISLCISILFIIKLFVLPTPATFVIIIVFFIAALFSGVLSQVFAQAIQYKEENDLTI